MIVDVDVPFADARAVDLRYLPDAPALAELGRLDLPEIVPGGSLSLRLLGASHQAVLTLPEGSYGETVACVGEAGSPLPDQAHVDVGPWRCRFDVHVATVTQSQLSSQCARLREHAEQVAPQTTLLGRFPGAPEALTWLSAEIGSDERLPGWTTVHVYPEAGEIVQTSTRLLNRFALARA